MDDPLPARALYHALLEYDGSDVYGDILLPWLGRAEAAGFPELIEPAAVHGAWLVDDVVRESRYNLLEQLYALSRVNDALILAFQPDAADDWLSIGLGQYLDFFAALGMAPVERRPDFDPFLHEIVAVRQDPDGARPIGPTEQYWPGLMLGEMLFSRAGVEVVAGTDHAEQGIADAAPMYWTYRRSYRRTVDLSLGWGHNSQWATDFRRDYRTADADHLNVDGSERAEEPDDTWEPTSLLTAAERRDLVRHRSLIRTPEAIEALDREPSWAAELMPFEWRLTVPRGESSAR